MASGSATQNPPATARRDRTHWLYIAVIVAVALGIAVGFVVPRVRHEPEVARHGVRGPDPDADRAGHLLHHRAGHRRDPAGGQGRPDRRAGAGLLHDHDDRGAGHRAARRATSSTPVADWSSPTNCATRGRTLASTAEESGGTVDFLLGLIPTTLVSALTEGSVLQALLVALLVGFAIQSLGRRASRCCGRRLPAEAGLPDAVDDHVAGADRRLRCHRRGGRARPAWDALKSLAVIMLGVLRHLRDVRLRVPRDDPAAGRPGQHLQAAEVPGPRVPADRVDVVVGDGAAPADRQDGARRREPAGRRASSCRPGTRSTSTARRST